MLVHLAKTNQFDLKPSNIGFFAAPLWGVSTVLKDTGIELLRFAPGLGWVAEVFVAVLFVFFLGILANLYFRKLIQKRPRYFSRSFLLPTGNNFLPISK